MNGLANKVALVTGAASGIGRAAADLLAEQGVRIWRADIGPADEQGAVQLDVTSDRDWTHAIGQVLETDGVLDILVNAAGISMAGGPAGIADAAIDDWRRIFAVNVEGTLLGCQHAIRAMGARGGVIVNISSTTACAPTPTLGAYGASKAAVLQMTKSVAAHCALQGLPIRCNAVMPGMTETPLIGGMPDAAREKWLAQIPAGRFATPEEIAEIILFLAGNGASYVNATGVPVDGGLLGRPVIR